MSMAARPKAESAATRLLGLRVRIPPGHGCLSLVSVVCCQVEISELGWSLVRKSVPSVVCLNECDSETSIMRRPWPTSGCWAMEKKSTATNCWRRDNVNEASCNVTIFTRTYYAPRISKETAPLLRCERGTDRIQVRIPFSRNIRGTRSLNWNNETDAPASFTTTKITFCTVQGKSENNNTRFPVSTAQLRYKSPEMLRRVYW
jgi:hypothetical protein